MQNTEKKWTLVAGCTKGTIASRDVGSEKCTSLEECKHILAEMEKNWACIGYRKWFAEAHGPDGEKVKL